MTPRRARVVLRLVIAAASIVLGFAAVAWWRLGGDPWWVWLAAVATSVNIACSTVLNRISV